MLCALQHEGVEDWVTALAPAEMAINNAVADGTGRSPAHVAYGMLLTMPVDVNQQAGVSQSPATEAFVANWEQIAKRVDQQLIRA